MATIQFGMNVVEVENLTQTPDSEGYSEALRLNFDASTDRLTISHGKNAMIVSGVSQKRYGFTMYHDDDTMHIHCHDIFGQSDNHIHINFAYDFDIDADLPDFEVTVSPPTSTGVMFTVLSDATTPTLTGSHYDSGYTNFTIEVYDSGIDVEGIVP